MKNFLLLLFVGIYFQIFAQNNPPIAGDDIYMFPYDYVYSDSGFSIDRSLSPRINFNDFEPDGDSMFIDTIIYTGPGTLSYYPMLPVINMRYKPVFGFVGSDSFIYVVRDNGNPIKYDTATVTITIMRKPFENLDANNVIAKIHKSSLFRRNGFVVPKNSRVSSILESNIWISGTSNGSRYTNIRAFAPDNQPSVSIGNYTSNCGPVSNTYQSDSLYNTKWDRVWKVSQHQIDWHLMHYTNSGYVAPQELLDWPAHGNVVNGEAANLAPFVDNNNDQIYNPYDGDYPLIKGDQAIYFIYNDGHSPISLNPMKSEVHGMAYAFDCPDSALQNTVFVDYKIFNRSNRTYDSTFIGMWSDMDVGNAQDDYIQCDVDRSLFYTFNGDDFDEYNSGFWGYGNHPGAQAAMVLKGAKMDDDGMDNAFGIGMNESVNGTGFGDGIVDNEYRGMESFVYYQNSGGGMGNPYDEIDYYNVSRGLWRDGTPMVYGGAGYPYQGGGPWVRTKYKFPGTSDTYHYGTGGVPMPNWTEFTRGNVPSYRRGVASTGPMTFAPGDAIELTYAFVFGRDHVNQGAQAGVTVMLERADSIRSYYDQGLLSACGFPVSVNETSEMEHEILIYPNPANQFIHIELSQSEEIKIEILDAAGKLFISKRGNGRVNEIDLSSLSKGIYLVQVTSKSGRTTQKIIKY